MIALLKYLYLPWEDARGYLLDDLTHLESAINQRWGKTFGDSNTLQIGTITVDSFGGDGTIATRYLANTGAGNAPTWDQVNLSNGVQSRLPFANFVSATGAKKLVGRQSGSGGDFDEIILGSNLDISTSTLAVTSAALTKTDDTNVTLTLGGSPTTALLNATSLTLGWAGTLADSRLSATAVTPASYGSATQTGTFTVGATGRLTAASDVTITPAVGSITGLGTGVATALGVNVGTDGAFVIKGGVLGTPSSGVGTNITGIPAGNILAGTFGVGAYAIGTSLALGGATIGSNVFAVNGQSTLFSTLLILTNGASAPFIAGTQPSLYIDGGSVVSGDGAGISLLGGTTANVTGIGGEISLAGGNGKAGGGSVTITGGDRTLGAGAGADVSVNPGIGSTGVYGTIYLCSAGGFTNIPYLTASEIVITDSSSNLVSAATTTYPSLTELSYVKGTTSALQTQLDNKQPLDSDLTTWASITPGTGVATALGVNVGTAGAFLVNGGSGYVASITGTANQVIASSATGAVTLSLPQSIATASAVQFGSVAIGGAITSGGNLFHVVGSPTLIAGASIFDLAATPTATANGNAILWQAGGNITPAASGTHALFAFLDIVSGIGSDAGATITDAIGVNIRTFGAFAHVTTASGIKVVAPTGAGTNYAAQFSGAVAITGTTTVTGALQATAGTTLATSSGRVLIGETTASFANFAQSLEVKGAAPGITIINSAGGGGGAFTITSTARGGAESLEIWDETASAYRLTLLANGNLGINNVAPGSKLSVVGLPTSSAGLSTGDIWYDTSGGFNILKIV